MEIVNELPPLRVNWQSLATSPDYKQASLGTDLRLLFIFSKGQRKQRAAARRAPYPAEPPPHLVYTQWPLAIKAARACPGLCG